MRASAAFFNVVLALASVAGAAGCASRPHSTDPRGSAALPARDPGRPNSSNLASNVARDDYVGSATCAGCHPSVAAAWLRSPMHRMTRDARGADVHAPFDGRVWHFKGDAVVLEMQQGERFMRIEPQEGATKTYRVTRVIGGRTREDFAGVEVLRDRVAGGIELVLPVSFVIATGAFRYKGYSVMVHERPTLRAGPVWNRTCIFCHNTVPEMDRFLGAIAEGARSFQGETVDPWLAVDRRAQVHVVDEPPFVAVANDEIERLGGKRADPSERASLVARRAVDAVRAGFDGRALVEVGIGCEACHGGGRRHAGDPSQPPSLVPTASWLRIQMPNGTAQAVNRVCARCHQVLFSGYPFTWEGGRRDAAAGGSHINSGEARDFLLGGCSAALPCTTCHDPHGGDDTERLRRLVTPAGNGVCTKCHAELGERQHLRAHAHHDPDGAGGACVSCHMPRKNMGLDGTLTRYHRIGSPTDPARVLGDRPLECALCHADRTVQDLIGAMEAWWPVRYPRQRLEELYGPLDGNAMRATLERGKPHERAVAIATFGEAHVRDVAPLIARELVGDYPLVREWAKRAIEAIDGPCDIDLSTDDVSIASQGARCLAAAAHEPPPAAGRSGQ